jgi:hypothetical protein
MKKLMTIMFVIAIMMMVAMPMNAFADSSASIDDVSVTGQNNGDINSGNTYNTIDRKFVSPGVVPMAGTNGFFTAPTEDSSIRSIFELVMISDRFSDGAVDNLAKGGDVDVHLQIVNEDKIVPRVKYKEGEVPMIQVIILKKGDKLPANFKFTGYADGEADDADTNSFQVAGKMMQKALADGNNCIIFTKEGGHRGVFASGWGIGLYTAGGKVSKDGMNSGTVGGGLGYSRNNTGAEEKPWLQGVVGVLK